MSEDAMPLQAGRNGTAYVTGDVLDTRAARCVANITFRAEGGEHRESCVAAWQPYSRS